MVYDPPVIEALACRLGCSASSSTTTQAAGSVLVRETGRIAIKGLKVSDTTFVVFLGGKGSRDDVTVAPYKVGKANLAVTVPTTAISGKIALIDVDGQISKASLQALKIVHYKKTTGGVVPGEKPPVETRPVDPPPNDTHQGLHWPLSGPITSPFGPRWGRMHNGIDIGVDSGTPIHAAASGRVILAGSEGGYGNFTCIKHAVIITCYAHQSVFMTTVGAHVVRGEVIGLVGCTGNCFGDHLHFEVRIGDTSGSPYNATPVDPMPYLPALASSAGSWGMPVELDYDLPVHGPTK